VGLGAPFCSLRHEKTGFWEVVMSSFVMARRAALVGFGAFASAGLTGCNTTPTPAVQYEPSGFRIGSIDVNTAPLLAQSGDPTASWVQQALPGQLARVLAAHMAPGAPGATLNARVDSIYLGLGGSANPDTIKGVVTLSGGGGPAQEISVHAIAIYYPGTVAQGLPEQVYQGRVTTLSQAFAYRLKRKLGL
jgi:hypothetical protein